MSGILILFDWFWWKFPPGHCRLQTEPRKTPMEVIFVFAPPSSKGLTTQATLKLFSLMTSNTEQVIHAFTGGILFKKCIVWKSALLAKQFFLFFSTVCSRGRLSNSEAVFIDDSLLLIVRPTLPLIATPRQGTSSQNQKSYLYLGFSVCPTQPIFTNTEREMLSSHSLQTKIEARANQPGSMLGMSTLEFEDNVNYTFEKREKRRFQGNAVRKKPGIVSLS